MTTILTWVAVAILLIDIVFFAFAWKHWQLAITVIQSVDDSLMNMHKLVAESNERNGKVMYGLRCRIDDVQSKEPPIRHKFTIRYRLGHIPVFYWNERKCDVIVAGGTTVPQDFDFYIVVEPKGEQ